MKPVSLTLLIAASLIASAGGALAQNNNPPAQNVEQPSNTPQNRSQGGTAPENMGATGWTGGSRGQPQDSTAGSAAADTAAAKDQPAVATGEDLKGPAKQFPANKTPE